MFVVGCPRSGTSWVRNMLGSHPGAHAGPESHLYPTVHGVAATWGDGPARWSEVLDRYDALDGHAGAGPHLWIDRPELQTLLDRAAASCRPILELADDVVAGVVEAYRRRTRLTPTTVLVEKTPDHLYWADRILTRFPNSRIVEVRRDGRDVCVSMERRAQRVAWPPKERREQIRRWIDAMRVGMQHSADVRFTPRWHLVRYEDLSADRRLELARLLTFVGLDADPAVISDIVSATDISRSRRTGDGEHVRTGAVGDWRAYFDSADIDLFDELAADLARRAGYAV